MRNNGQHVLDELAGLVAERNGVRTVPRDAALDDAKAEIVAELNRFRAAVERLTELVESRPVNREPEPLLLDRQAAAKSLGISASLLDNMRRDGVLPAVVLGKGKPMWLATDLRTFAENHRERRPPKLPGADAA